MTFSVYLQEQMYPSPSVAASSGSLRLLQLFLEDRGYVHVAKESRLDFHMNAKTELQKLSFA